MSLPPENERLAAREAFLNAIPRDRYFHRLMDHLPDVLFFAKDAEGRLYDGNTALLRRYGYAGRENEFWGLSDFEILPRSLAEKFRRDDLGILKSGRPMLEIVELYITEQGIPGWFLTNKLPIPDKMGNVIGIMGTITPYRSHVEELPSEIDISGALRHIQLHYASDKLTVKKLAEMANLSVRQFERRFRDLLKTTPQQFIIKMRVYAACDELRRSTKPISEIAIDCGFYDQSAFTTQFRKHMGITPLQYRKQYR